MCQLHGTIRPLVKVVKGKNVSVGEHSSRSEKQCGAVVQSIILKHLSYSATSKLCASDTLFRFVSASVS